MSGAADYASRVLDKIPEKRGKSQNSGNLADQNMFYVLAQKIYNLAAVADQKNRKQKADQRDHHSRGDVGVKTKRKRNGRKNCGVPFLPGVIGLKKLNQE